MAPSKPPEKEKLLDLSSENLGVETVSILVGPRWKEFTIHKKLLCCRSLFFDKTFNGGFKEAVDRIMYFPEDDANVFDAYVNWLYRGSLPTLHFLKDRIPGPLYNNTETTWWETKEILNIYLIPLFILAEKIYEYDLVNRVIDLIQDCHAFHWKNDYQLPAADLTWIYAHTPPESTLRSFLAALFAWILENPSMYGNDITVYSSIGTSQPDFVSDVFRFQVIHNRAYRGTCFRKWDPRFRTEVPPASRKTSLGLCHFHRHSEGEECYLKQI